MDSAQTDIGRSDPTPTGHPLRRALATGAGLAAIMPPSASRLENVRLFLLAYCAGFLAFSMFLS